MFKKHILLISLLALVGIANADNITYTVNADAYTYANLSDYSGQTSETHGGEPYLYSRSTYSFRYIKFNDVALTNASSMTLTCKLHTFSGSSYAPYVTIDIADEPTLSSWSEVTISGANQPCWQCDDAGTNTCAFSYGITPCASNVYLNSTENLGMGSGTFTGTDVWDSVSMNLNGEYWNSSIFEYTGDLTFYMLYSYAGGGDLQYIYSKESGDGCNLTVDGGIAITTTTIPVDLDLTVNIYDSVNTTEPIENANVTISNLDFPPPLTNDVSDLTNSSGTVIFGITVQGEYEVIVTKFDYATSYNTVLMFYDNETLDIYLDKVSTDTTFNFTVYDKVSNATLDNVKLEFIECQGGDTPFLDCALNYPNGIYTSIATRYTNSNGNFEGTINQMTTCFLIGFRKDGYVIPEPDVFVNSKAICLDESWYSSETNSYTMPYFDYYMFPDVTDVTVTYTVRDGDSYVKLEDVNISIDYPSGLSDTQLTDSDGQATFTNGNGCWDLTLAKLPYHTLEKTDCFYDDGNYNRTLYLLLNESDSDSNISTFNLTGFVFGNADALPLADVYLDCEIFCLAGYSLYETHDITITNNSGEYRFEGIRENAECDVRANAIGYSEDVEHFAMLDNEEINLTLTYLGKQLQITGVVTDCDSLNPLVAKVEIWHCGNATDYDASLPCDYLIAQLTNEDGEFDFVNILEGYIQFVITEEYHEEIAQTILIQADAELKFCLHEGQPRYWLRGMVQNVSWETAGGPLPMDDLLYTPIEAEVKVYDKDTNALVKQMVTNRISGYFAFELRKGYYIVIAEAHGESDRATIYLDHNYGQEELILTIGERSIQDGQINDFMATLSGLLPSVIILFIFLMVVQAMKHVSSR